MDPGDLVAGRYHLQAEVGAGAMGVVWRAVDTELDRVVALKRTRGADAEPGDDARLRREARAAAGVHHPAVVTLFDVIRDGSGRWLVMEYLPSRSLADVLDTAGALAPAEVARIGVELAGALAAVHTAGVLHRDVKPGNVLIAESGAVKLTDFGISRIGWGDETVTAAAMVAGTPAYLAPEVAGGEPPTAAADVFALGATLFAAVEGEPPYGRTDNPLAMLRKATAGEIRAPQAAGPLTGVLGALLAVDPGARPSAAQAREMLQAVADGQLPAPAAPAQRSAATTGGRGRRLPRRVVVALAAAVAVAASVGLAAAVTRSGSGSVDRPDATGPTAPATDLGDRRTADPCALVDTVVLAPFGDVELDPAYAGFERCDVVLQTPGTAVVDVEYRLAEPDEDTGVAPAGIRVVRSPAESDECLRTLVLPSGERVLLKADFEDPGAGADLCAVADAATTAATGILQRGPLARRGEPFPVGSLARVDACTLLDGTALARVPGLDAADPERDFGDWSCGWESSGGDAVVELTFGRHPPLDADDGRRVQLAGRQAYVDSDAEGPGTCVAQVVNRAFEVDDRPKVELVQLMLRADGSAQRRCAAVTDLAAAVARRLPAL